MRLRVVNGFYDAEKGRIIEKNEIIEASDKEAAKLLARKLVIEAPEKAPEKPKTKAKGKE